MIRKTLFGGVLVALLVLGLIPGLGSMAAQAAAATYYVDGQSGSDSNPGTQAAPWMTIPHAVASIQAGDTVVIAAGIYRIAQIRFSPAGLGPNSMTTFKAAPGARVVISRTDDYPPQISVADYVRLEGLWLGGKWDNAPTQVGGWFQTGGSPISRGVQVVDCTLFGFREGIQIGSSEYQLIQGNRLVHNGYGELMHGIYLSGGSSPSASNHIIVDHNLFIRGQGWGIHGWHDIRSAIVTRNFVAQFNYGLVLDGSDHLVANNMLWRQHGGDYSARGPRLAGTQTQFLNNVMGPSSAFEGDTTSNTLRQNAFLGTTPYGQGAITLTGGQEASQLGASAPAIDNAIATLDNAFSQSVAAIYADSAIEPAFEILRMAVPSGSPLYGTGIPWFGQVVNVGPDSPAPSTTDGFWAAFHALGLRDWDRFGQVGASTATPAATATPGPTRTPTAVPTVTRTPTVGPTATPTPIFGDVPPSHWAHDYIEALFNAGYVAGCSSSPRLYCPDNILSRAESAVFVERGAHGALPEAPYPPPSSPTFVDVPASFWGYGWIESLWLDSFTAGCSVDPRAYCPNSQHTRAEGSVFFLRMMLGVGYSPPAPTGLFTDVPLTAWYAGWVEAAYREGLLPECHSLTRQFCPDAPLDRSWAAYVMTQARGMPLPTVEPSP